MITINNIITITIIHTIIIMSATQGWRRWSAPSDDAGAGSGRGGRARPCAPFSNPLLSFVVVVVVVVIIVVVALCL